MQPTKDIKVVLLPFFHGQGMLMDLCLQYFLPIDPDKSDQANLDKAIQLCNDQEDKLMLYEEYVKPFREMSMKIVLEHDLNANMGQIADALHIVDLDIA